MSVEGDLSELESRLYLFVKEKKTVSFTEVRSLPDGEKLLGALGRLVPKNLVEIITLKAEEQPVKELRKVIKVKEAV